MVGERMTDAGSVMMGHIRQLTNILPQPVRFGLRRRVFAGREHTCVLCGNGIRTFASHGGGAKVLTERKVVGGMRRDHDRCPVCHGSDRTRLIMLYLDRETTLGRAPTQVLHVAPDFGLYLWLKGRAGVRYFGSDLDASRYRHIAGMAAADLTQTPFDSASFDIVICSHVLEHVPDDGAAFAELHRILKPGGHAVLLTPFALDGRGTDEDLSVTDPGERDRRYGQWDHVRLYDRGDFLGRMRAAGFAADLYDPYSADPARADALHLNPDELLPIGRKSLA